MLLQGARAQSGDRRAELRGTGVPSALGGARQIDLGSGGLGRGLCASAGSWGATGCRLLAWTMAPPAPDTQAQEGQTARVQGRPVYSEGAHALWLVGQTAMSVGGSGSGQRERQIGVSPGRLPAGAKPGSLGYFLGAALQGGGACPEVPSSGARGLCPQTAHPRTGQRAAPTAPALKPASPQPNPWDSHLGLLLLRGLGGNGVQRKVCFIASI